MESPLRSKGGSSEAAFCDRLRTWAENLGFTVYPEIEGWDMVLCAKHEILIDNPRDYRGTNRGYGGQRVPAGAQLGIHAKLVANSDVLAQAVGPLAHHDPAYPALPFVAVPRHGESFAVLARHMGVGIVTGWQDQFVISVTARQRTSSKWLTLPPIASRAIQAGVPSPRSLGEWRLKALRFLEWARAQDSFAMDDLRRFGLNPSTCDSWLYPIAWKYADGKGKRAVVKVRTYRIQEGKHLPDAGYEDVMAELRAAGKLDPPPATLDPNPATLPLPLKQEGKTEP